MLLSIITINLNNAAGLQRTIDSLLMQTYQDFEWIVIDGGSTDGSVSLLENCRNRINHFVSEPDQGIYQAMNKGIRKATGTYLLFLNSGDRLSDETVLASFASQQDGHDFIVGRMAWDGDNLALSGKRAAISPEDEVFHLCVSAYPHQATFIRREVFQKYGLYREDKRLASDWYCSVNALIKGTATVSHWPVLVSICEKDGISSRLHQDLYRERAELVRENPYFSVLFDFYTDNREIISALKSNKVVFFLFRVYYFLYRRIHRISR